VRWIEVDNGYETPCWMWQLSCSRNGYGQVKDQGTMRGAHVVAWEGGHGPVPEGLELHHLCGHRACVRPDHMEALTRYEHVHRDRPLKLTVEQVHEIRRLAAAGWSQRRIARAFGISSVSVCMIARRKAWAFA